MPISNCRRCGRIFNQVRREICPACILEEEKWFTIVKAYLRDHRDASLAQVSEATAVEAVYIVDMIRNGRLMLRDNPNIQYECERCGEPTQSGRYCGACTKILADELSQASGHVKLRKDAESQGKGYFSR